MSNVKTSDWREPGVSAHPSIWDRKFTQYLSESAPWAKKQRREPAILAAPATRPVKKVVSVVSKYVPETQDESLTIEKLSSMYCTEPAAKKLKIACEGSGSKHSQHNHNIALDEDEIINELASQPTKSPILENKERSYRKSLKCGKHPLLKKLSRFSRTQLNDDDDVIESKFFNSIAEEITPNDQDSSKHSITIEESPEKVNHDSVEENSIESVEVDTDCILYTDSGLGSSQKENSPQNSPAKKSPVFEPSPKCRNHFKRRLDSVNVLDITGDDSVIENTYASQNSVTTNIESQPLFDDSPPKPLSVWDQGKTKIMSLSQMRKASYKAPGPKKSLPVPSNQPTLLGKFGFQKKPVLRR